MNRRSQQALQRLAAQKFSDGVPSRQVGTPPWQRSQDDARVALESAALAPRAVGVARRRVLVAAAGVTVLAAAGSMVVASGLSSPPVDTPPLLVFEPGAPGSRLRELLRDLADRAERQPRPLGAGPVLYAQRRQWSFSTSMDTAGRTLGSQMSESLRETWLRPDGSGRGFSQDFSVPPDSSIARMDWTIPAGPASPALMSMSGDARLAWFTSEERRDWTGGRWIRDASNWQAQLGDPAVAAMFLRVLADKPGLTVEGNTTDRAGRRAVVVSATLDKPGDWFPQQRHYLLCDPDTGLILATDEVALTVDTEAMKAPLATPATTGYTLWLTAAHVADTNSRP